MKRFAILVVACFVLAGCGSAVNPSNGSQSLTNAARESTASQTLYAFSPGTTPLIAAYPADATGVTAPKFTLEGPTAKTLYSPASLGIDSSGALLAIAGSPVKFLKFPSGSSGTSAPASIARLPSTFIPTFDGIGFAMDANGNFWTTANDKLMRFPVRASGSTQPNLTINPVIETPIGKLRARALNVALDAQGNVYCACEVVANGGAQASGISEYSVDASGKVHLVKSFYDLQHGAEEVPPQSIAIDSAGWIYLASVQIHAGIRVYSPNTHSGSAHARRFIVGDELDYIAAIAVDSSRHLYVAVSRGIAVFGPTASGPQNPKRWILDKKHLAFGDNGFAGTLLVIR